MLCKTCLWTLSILPSILNWRLCACPGLSIHSTHLQFAPVSKTKTWRENNNPKMNNFTETRAWKQYWVAWARWHCVWALCSILNHRSRFIIIEGFSPRAPAPCGSHQCQIIICDSKLKTTKHTSGKHMGMRICPVVLGFFFFFKFYIFWQWSRTTSIINYT